jgi:stress-induced morphogen
MVVAEKIKNHETALIEQKLKPHFSNVEAYRYNVASIRVRVIDSQFQGKSKVDRFDIVSSCLDELPEDIQTDITILLILTPEEIATSPMNVEFEYPSPSRL